MKNILKLIISSHSGVSSKRVCGLLGFLVIAFILIYCTIKELLAPTIVEPFIYIVCMLLGIDSVTGIWKKTT